MAQATKEKSLYHEAWESSQREAARSLPAWAVRWREDAFAAFERLGFPTTSDEEWKYTSVAPIARADFAPAAAVGAGRAGAGAITSFLYPESLNSRLVFVDGVFSAELSSLEALPAGVIVTSLGDALRGRCESDLRERVGRAADFNADGFAALNAAFLEHGAFIRLPKGARVDAPLHLLFVSGAAGAQVIANPRVIIVAEEDSSATIIEDYQSAADEVYLTNAVVEVFVGERARVAHFKVQGESAGAFHVATTAADLARDAAYDLTTITLGARLSRHAVHVRLAHEGAECWIDGLYLVGAAQHADTHSAIDHVAPRCTSHQLYKGILDGDARAVFNGKVFVRPGAQQTDAKQTNKNLLLSPDARVDTKPQLEIFADDVKCAHGATVGQLDEEELFYLKSRGLHDELARNLLTYGFAEELVDKIKIESIKRQLDEAILNRLHARLEA
ncbi:MAG TPA: Fe-S cluster assembly protein SufD [Pyrinomonadaceae bacterium]|nr:Fe-S cluster assembly protein SufD [Pyrinomonadaceae bacterium]